MIKVNPRALRPHASRVLHYLTRRTEGLAPPRALVIETTLRCNLDCPMCYRPYVDEHEGLIPDDWLYSAIDQHAEMGGDHLYPYGLGEPLLDKRIFDIVRYARSRGLTVMIPTNGTGLTEAKRAEVLASGLDHLIVGIDATDAETYGFYRKGGNYERTVANVHALAVEKLAAGSSLNLVVQFVRMERNWDQARAFLDYWSKVPGVDAARIKQEDLGVDEHRTTLSGDGDLRRNPCHMLWNGPMVIRTTGEVFPCYHMPWVDPGCAIGHIGEDRLVDIWRSAKMQQWRAEHASGQLRPGTPCYNCPAQRPRLPFILAAMTADAVTSRRMLYAIERLGLRYPALWSEPRRRQAFTQSL